MNPHEDFNELASLLKAHLSLLKQAHAGKLKEDSSWEPRTRRLFEALKLHGYIRPEGPGYVLSARGKKALAGWEEG